MPRERLHMTASELSHSVPCELISTYIEILRPQLPDILSLQTRNRTALVKPVVSCDAAAMEISFVPGEGRGCSYHHLRCDLYNMVAATGVEVATWYALPPAYITIGRFVTARNHYPTEGGVSIEKWLNRIGEINKWLENVQVRWTANEEVGWFVELGDCGLGMWRW
ncbi:RNA ligase/cyclic nucleotide phosphodiesterase [Tuber brumale]|nr:RNA ligase/cyclic nucleotide phosphodiesterase [Tuber brumale]